MSLSGKNVLITGGAGFIGSHLVDRIAQEHPAKIVVVDNLFLGQTDNLTAGQIVLGNEKLKTYWEDASQLDRMRDIVTQEKIEVIYDLAVLPLPASLERPYHNVQQNVQLTLVLCELLREKRYATLIHFSSSEAYGTAREVPISENHPYLPSTPYAASKVAGDHICLSYWETFWLDIAILRPFNNYGPRQNDFAYAGIIPVIAKCVATGRPIEIFGDGEQTRDLIFVRDTVEAAVRMYGEPKTRGTVVNVASGHEISINQLVRRTLHAMGLDDYPVIHTAPRPGDVRRHCGSTLRAQELLGFTPTVSLDDGLRETMAWYQSRHAVSDKAA